MLDHLIIYSSSTPPWEGKSGSEWAEVEVFVSKVDPCDNCGKRLMANSVLCVKFRKWIHGRCAKVKRVIPRLGRDFVCGRCKKQVDDGLVESVELCKRWKQ